jgi:predicted amidohydrolase
VNPWKPLCTANIETASSQSIRAFDHVTLPLARSLAHHGGMRPRDPLVLAVAQPATVSFDVAANAATHADAVRAARARIVVFPELSLTGYELDAPAIAPGDARLAPIVDACAATGGIALAGAPVDGADEGRAIGILAIDGSGATVAYEKMWLGGSEPACFSPGRAPAVLEIDGWRLGLAICKDTGVAAHAAATATLGIHAYVAGVLETTDDAAVVAERALRVAADHAVWVAIASFAGSTGGGYDRAAGGSGIWRPDGSMAARAGAAPGEIVRAPLLDPAA